MMFLLESFNNINFKLSNYELHAHMSNDHIVRFIVYFKIWAYSIKFISYLNWDYFIDKVIN